MKRTLWNLLAAAALTALPSVCQQTVPIYRTTVIQRSIDAVNYRQHAGPTKIDFKGTVLLPAAKGDATIEAQKGHTVIDAKLDGLTTPQRYGAEYLSYVVWAITPDGSSHNLGEVIPGASDKAHLTVTTDLQSFGLIVTAEPYASVRQPSDVIVLQNEVRPDTIGSVQPIHVRYELMPRGKYTWNVPAGEPAELASAPKVSMHRYQAILQVYEAQNALGVARTAGAEQYAPEVYAKAQQEFDTAQQLRLHSKSDDDVIVQHARAATEIAEDARTIAERHQQEAVVVAARQETVAAQQTALRAQASALRERQRADDATARADAEHAARERAELDARMAREHNTHTTPIPIQVEPPPAPAPDLSAAAKETRVQLLQRLNTSLYTRDTPRGLNITLNDSDFAGAQLRPGPAIAISQTAAVLMAHPDLKVRVEGNCDVPEGSEAAAQRASTVAAALVRAGVPASQVSSAGLGNSRPIVSNATPQGRTENRRVEIVISGDSIGALPTWDRTYTVAPNAK